MNTNFKDKNQKPEKNYENYNTFTSTVESVNAVFIIGATTAFVILTVSVVCLILVSKSSGMARALSLGNKVLQKIKLKKKYKKNNLKRSTNNVF